MTHAAAVPQQSLATTALLRLIASVDSLQRCPTVGRTLPVGELVHRALVRMAAGGGKIDCPELTGQDAWGQPLSGRHEHAHILPLDLDCDGFLDHVLLHAALGFGERAVDAIESLRCLHSDLIEPLHVRLLELGDFEQILRRVGGGVCNSSNGVDLSPAAPAAVWTSLTPFVPPRYLKKSGKNSLEGQLAAELESRSLPPFAKLDVLGQVDERSGDFTLCRGGRGRPPAAAGFALRLRFDRPLDPRRLPLALGYASHFGLGLFRAEPIDDGQRSQVSSR